LASKKVRTASNIELTTEQGIGDSGRLCREGRDRPGLAYVYAHMTKQQAETAKVLTMDEARRVASNIAKLPTLLARR
jgi:hypothetical protein